MNQTNLNARNIANDVAASPSQEDDATGLPAFGSWRAVYFFVTAVFIAYVLLLGALSSVFA